MSGQTDEMESASILLAAAGMLPAHLSARRITPTTCCSGDSKPEAVRHNARQGGQHARAPHFL